jgi:hypothetical protein
MEHRRAIADVMSMLGDTPMVFDLEFSYESFFEDLEIEGLKYVIRLSIVNNPILTYEKGKKGRQVKLDINPGQTKILAGVNYNRTVKMNPVGYWQKGMKEAMWIVINLDPKTALKIYLDRMKIEESFKDLKSLFGLERIMSKDRQYMEKIIMLVLIS